MRRLVLGLAGLAVAVGVALGAVVARTPPGLIETELLSALRNGSGLTVAARRPATFALFPTPHVRLEDVTVFDAAGVAVMSARAVIATPRLKSLIAGAVEIDEITLKTPVLPVQGLDLKGIAATAVGRASAGGRLPTLRIADGVITWSGGRIDDVEAGVVWPRVGRSLSLTAAGAFNGAPVEVRLSIDDPADLVTGGRTGVKTKFSGGGARLAFEGVADESQGAQRLDGALRFRAGSLKDLARWFGGVTPALGAPLADVTLSGDATIDRTGVDVQRAELAIDGANYIGGTRFALKDGRPALEATLAARDLDLTHYVDGFSPTLADGGGWSAEPLDVRPFRALDLDLRLSADAVRLGSLRLGPTAATVGVANGALDIAVGEAAAYGGLLGGRVQIQPDGRTARVRLQIQGSGIGLVDALTDVTGAAPLSGALSAEATLEGRGASIAELVRGLDGRGSASLAGGTIGGFRAKALTLLGYGSQLEIRSIDGTMTMTNGVARTGDLALGGDDAWLRLSGEADIFTRRMSLAGTLGAASGPGPTAPVRVDGAFLDPKLRLGRPDRRSAAPAAGTEKASAATP